MDNVLKGFIKAIFILGVLFVIFYMVRYSFWNSRSIDDNLDLSDYFEEPERKDEQVDTEVAKELYELINFKKINYNFGEEFWSFYYGGRENLISKFSNSFIVYLGVINAVEDRLGLNCNDSFKVDSSNVDLEIKKIFGDIKYTASSFTLKNKALKVTYNEKDKTYTVENKRCSGIEFGSDHIETKMVDVKMNDNYLEIYEISYYVSYDNNSDGSYVVNYHKGPNKDTSILCRNEIENIDGFQQYKYTFEKKDDSYVFSKVESVENV